MIIMIVMIVIYIYIYNFTLVDKPSMPPDTQEDVYSTVAAFTAGCGIRKAALKLGAPRAALQDRIEGALAKTEA